MACYTPLDAWKGPNGITFDQKAGYYDMPLHLACGQCIGCRKDRLAGWTIRALHEAQMHEESCFLTLTYNDANLPADRSLDVAHWQRFAKRLRKAQGPFRFLHCGEYGGQNHRPHYHALIFGKAFYKDSIEVKGKNGPFRVSESLTKLWPFGYHAIGELNYTTARYVASYTIDKLSGEKQEAALERVDPLTGETWCVSPEYATMSRRPGLGKSWFEKYAGDVYPDNFVIINGRKMKPPSYYDKLLEEQDPQLHSKMKEQRKREIRKNAKHNTHERLKVREKVAHARLNHRRTPKGLD